MVPPLRWQRMKHRVLHHHLALALVSAVLLFAVYLYVGRTSDDAVFIWSMATAYASMVLLVATLLTGPVNVLRGRRNPVSTDIRRDIGIWAALLGLVHVVVGLQVHFRGKMWFYFVREVEKTNELVLRADLFGFANYTGLLATLLLVLLLALSNDVSLRILKATRWKSLQRWNYALFMLVVIHGIAYQVIETRGPSYVLLLAVLVVLTVVLQLAGYRERRGKPTSRTG
jgi:sulfoxide reductase heme-binding subunit YedZ